MADKDLLGQSLSEEEELALPPPGKRSTSLSPSRTPKTRGAKGYKFTSESTSKPDNFDFATQSKNGSHQPSTTGSSSEEGEEFEHLNPLEAVGGGSGGDPPQVPPQVNKLPTPHKRTAELAENGDNPKSFKGFGINGSPPSSPAAKKRKNFQDYLAEDEAKRQQKLQETGREGPSKEIGGDLGNLLKFGGIMVSILLAVGLAIYFSEVDMVNVMGHGGNPVEPQKISKYGWNSASEKIHRSLKQLEKQFPKQNRETWIQLHSSILSTFSKTEPVHPSAITLLYSSSIPSKFPLCFTSKIAQAINVAVAPILQNVNSSKLAKPHPPKIITPELFQQQTITQIRIGLDNYFNLKGKALVVDKVTEVKSEGDLLLFHGLCDNFKAVDKRATILFPVEVDKEILKRFEWIHDRAGDISQDVLNTKFARIVGADTGPSIVARIADAVVLINEGDKCD